MKIPPTSFKNLYEGDNSLKLLDQSYLPRWMVVIFDTILSALSLFFVYIILLGTPIKFHEILSLPIQALIALTVTVVYFIVFKTYSGIIRHSTFTDILKLVISSFSTGITLVAINLVYSIQNDGKLFITTGILLYMLISFTVLLLFRLVVKESYQLLKNTAGDSVIKRVLIYGIDDHSLNVGKSIIADNSLGFNLIGFINDKFQSKGGKISGKPIITLQNNFENIIEDYKIDAIIIAENSYSIKQKNSIVELCLANNVEVFNVPSLEQLDTSEKIKLQIKPIQIEDLLERESIAINDQLIKLDIEEKTVLVTGGAGSIGGEIISQISKFNPKLLIVLDQAETALHELELHLKEQNPNIIFEFELASINNNERLVSIFSKYSIDIVYHAAAYKHVPMIERNPREAVFVNVQGTINLATLSIKHEVDKFVMISTDKAVNPTNVMGASKRAAEIYVQSIQNEPNVRTKFITTRFGNVMGSNGSVIPFFRKQIAKGGPVTVTHKDIIRYFMTIPEACQLVLQAGTMGHGGEIYVFDMGEQVKILDLAEKMIRLSGFEPYTDIDIQFIGLRPGEKLYEELLNDTSKSLPTHHSKIMITEVPLTKYTEVKSKINEIILSAYQDDDSAVVFLLKDLIPEYKSKNSIFEELDIIVNRPDDFS